MRSFKPGDSKTKQRSRDVPLSIEELSDEILLQALALGVIQALEILYQRYSRLLYSLAYRMVADHQIAEDLLQETFVSVWQNATTYSPKLGGARSWLVSIVRHRSIDYLRKLRSHQDFKATPLDDLAYDDSLTTPDAWEEVWRSVQGARVRGALQQLSQEQRMVIELAYFQGWTHSEIAERYQIPLGTVKARMRLGIMRLKQLLEQMGEES